MVELQTERLVLRPFTAADVDAYAAICADPEVMRYIVDCRPLSRQESWRQMAFFLGHWQLRGYGMWALEEKASGRLIGRTGFLNPEGWPGCELGWALGREFWGRGFASEAARAALAYGFGTLGLHRVISLVHPDNHRSIRVAERLGERRQGVVELYGRSVLVYSIDDNHPSA